MRKLIDFAVELMEEENRDLGDPHLLPSQNPEINTFQNRDINWTQNPKINYTQNPEINWTRTSDWKRNQWELFKELVLWEYLNENQKNKCKEFLKNLSNG